MIDNINIFLVLIKIFDFYCNIIINTKYVKINYEKIFWLKI